MTDDDADVYLDRLDARPAGPAATALGRAQGTLKECLRIRSKFGAASRVTERMIEIAESRMRKLEALEDAHPQPRPTAYDCSPIRWLESPITIGPHTRIVGFDPLTADPAVLELLGIDTEEAKAA
jgi:hypothetical protein